MRWPIAGIIEGFYGKPWSWDERAHLMKWCHERGMTHYVYAPKHDPKQRERWREPFDSARIAGLEMLVAEGTLHVGFGISPGLSMDYRSPYDRAALANKVNQVIACGIDLIVLALDDIPFGGAEQGREQADLTARLRDYLGDRASLILVPTEYVGTRATPYLDELAKGVPPDVPIAWTGSMVVNERITAEEADARAAALGGAAPLIWDNYPVNDSLMSDRLHLGPLWGRERALVDVCSGYLANPMVQPNASKLPLASVGAWLRGEDALDAWAEAADELGARVLAEACDGAVPGALVASAIEWIDEDDYVEEHVGALRQWLQAASCCEAGALGDEVTRWVEQARKEAVVGLHALKLIDLARAGRFDKVVEQGWLVAFNARELRRAPVSVMGSRWGFQPALGQRHDGTWSFHVSSMLEAANAIDDLVRAAISFASVRSTS